MDVLVVHPFLAESVAVHGERRDMFRAETPHRLPEGQLGILRRVLDIPEKERKRKSRRGKSDDADLEHKVFTSNNIQYSSEYSQHTKYGAPAA